MLEIEARIGDTVLDIVEGPCRAHDGTPLVTPGVVAIGVVTYVIRAADRARDVVPKPRIEKRIYAYLAASLVVQVALWLVAVTHAPLEKLDRRETRPLRIAHVHAPPLPQQPETPKPPPPKPTAATVASTPPAGRPSRRTPPREEPLASLTMNGAGARLAKTFDDIDVAGKLAHTDGPLYDPANDSSGFGGTGGHMQYDDTTYKVERWALPTYMHVKGELAPVPVIEWCDDGSCSTRGPLELEPVLARLLAHEAEIARCYREHTGDLVGNVRVRFPIGPDGAVTGKLGTETGPVGYGTGTVGRCIAAIAQKIRWPRANDETYVFVGLAFRPAAG